MTEITQNSIGVFRYPHSVQIHDIKSFGLIALEKEYENHEISVKFESVFDERGLKMGEMTKDSIRVYRYPNSVQIHDIKWFGLIAAEKKCENHEIRVKFERVFDKRG